MNPPRGDQRGFTIVELLVSLVISVVGFVGLIGMQRAMSSANQNGARQVEAIAFVQQAVEGLRQVSIAEMEARFGALPITTTLPVAIGRNGHNYSRQLEVMAIESSARLLKVRVVVNWNDDGTLAAGPYEHSMVLEVLRTREESL
jgi:prepilin-type N-terminal cleavage/methylation domain-containing protein